MQRFSHCEGTLSLVCMELPSLLWMDEGTPHRGMPHPQQQNPTLFQTKTYTISYPGLQLTFPALWKRNLYLPSDQ